LDLYKKKKGTAPPKRRLAFNWIRGVIAQKIELFIITAMWTWNW
jgi:hypothetical protein